MKKSLIALAVLAASGAAMAQSSVQIYGDIDMGLVKSKNTNPSTGAVLADKTGVDQGLISGANIGFKGTEDLGGGLKAVFKVETDFTPDAPSAGDATRLGSKYAYVGLAGSFGEVQLGRVGTAYDDVYANSHSSLDSDFAAPNVAFAGEFEADNARSVFRNSFFGGSVNNGIKYVSPSFAGFSGAVSYGFGENKSATQSADNSYSISGQYENGPIYVAAAYGSATVKADAGKDTGYNINGSYDLGVAKLKATYAAGKYEELGSADEKYSEYELAVDVPLTSALMISAGYAKSQDKVGAIKGEKRTGYNLTAFYTLSKRTMAYAGFSTANAKEDGVKIEKSKLYAVGIQHKF